MQCVMQINSWHIAFVRTHSHLHRNDGRTVYIAMTDVLASGLPLPFFAYISEHKENVNQAVDGDSLNGTHFYDNIFFRKCKLSIKVWVTQNQTLLITAKGEEKLK